MALKHLAVKDRDDARAAWELLADIDRRNLSFVDFAAHLAKFDTRAGASAGRRITVITWTKDRAQAPAPGVYAAVDIVSRWVNIDRSRGSLILYRPPGGTSFRIMREEQTEIDNTTAAALEKRSKGSLDAALAKLTACCPNFDRASAPLPAAPPAPVLEQPASAIGYPNVAAALAALHARPEVTFRVQNGWTIADDEAAHTLWSFPPVGYPAYPSAVKRHIMSTHAGVVLQMSVLCEADKASCDALVRAFEALNGQVKVRFSKPYWLAKASCGFRSAGSPQPRYRPEAQLHHLSSA